MSMKEIKLVDIIPDPNQPRKYFDEAAMNELIDSVREKGVLQPILVRPFDAGELGGAQAYMLVCGERRYRAAATVAGAYKSRDTIPAVIKELTDDEALELQIIENLQRKDVHPLEEAVAFKSLLDHGKEVKEVAARVGKSDFYVRQRVKLSELIKEWQTAYFAGNINSQAAMSLCTFDQKTQAEIWKERGGDGEGPINIDTWFINRYRGLLTKATFPLDDITLDKKAGACTQCPFNSAVASLFPESAANPICSKQSCFKHKSDIHFDRALKAACDDPEVILVNTNFSSYEDNLTRKLQKEGHQILNGTFRNNFEVVEPPEAPLLEDYDVDDYDNAKARKEAFDDDFKIYERELVDYNKKVVGGKLKKAFVIYGNDKGQYVHLLIGKASKNGTGGSSKATKEKESAGKLTAADIDEEIKRLQDREKRAKELDAEKVQGRIIEGLQADKSLKALPARIHENDIVLIRFLMQEHISFNSRDIIKKVTGLAGVWDDVRGEKMYKKLESLSDLQFSFLVRQLLVSKYATGSGGGPTNTAGYMLRRLAMSLGTIPIDAFEAEQKEAAAKRQGKVDSRIAQLREQKKTLSKPAAKTPTKGAPSKKKKVSTPPPRKSKSKT